MESKTVFTLIVSSLILLYYFVLKRGKGSKALNLPPGPPRLPLIGNIHQLMGALPHRALRDLARKHGPVMHLKLGSVSTIIFSSPSVAREVLKTKDLIFADRPKMECTEILYYKSSDIAISPYGDYWRQMKKICTLELLSEKKIRAFRAIRVEELGRLRKSLQVASGSTVNFKERIVETINSVILRASFGDDYKAQDQATIIGLIQDLMETSGAFNVGEFFPRLKFLNVVLGIKSKWMKIHKDLDKILEEVLELHKARQGRVEREEEDLVDVLLRIKDSDELESPVSYDNVKSIMLDMFAAGTDTSSATIIWAMAEMMRHPSVRQKAQEEVREAFKGKTTVTDSDVKSLKYLKCVIKETLRLHPPVPLLVPRECRQDCKVDGYDIPAKTKVAVNAFACATDPEYWDDPESFKPERFENNSINYMGTDYQYIPFGAGRRMCPGVAFGTNSVESTLAELLYHFNWQLPNGLRADDIDMEECDGITTTLKAPLHLIPTTYSPPAN